MWVRKSRGTVLILCGTVGIATASGCSDTVDTGPGDGGSGASGQGGSSGSAGSSGAGGAGRGGSAGSAGADGSATGGTSGTGDGGIFHCRPVRDEDPCVECARQNCCAEFEACGNDPDCSSGNEYECTVSCVRTSVADGGVADDDTFIQCASACASSGPIEDATNVLITCLRFGDHVDAASGADCLLECFEPADAR
jgi:hypothetical protein